MWWLLVLLALWYVFQRPRYPHGPFMSEAARMQYSALYQ